MLQSLGELLPAAARRFGDRTALVFGEREFSFRELDQLSNALARSLVALGVSPGDRVTLYAPNSWEWIVSYYGALKAGAVINPVNVMLTPAEVAFVTRDCGAKALIGSADKIAPALAAGCTQVLKPSEYTPTSALLFAEVLAEAGVPKGVFNVINGLGPDVGAAMSAHPGIDMISFTGSTRAGIDVAQRAAPTVKRVSQELGGKSPNIILDDADLQKAVTGGAAHCFNNSGQSCNAPTRMLVPQAQMNEAANFAKAVAEKTKAGMPRAEGTNIGPVVNKTQW